MMVEQSLTIVGSAANTKTPHLTDTGDVAVTCVTSHREPARIPYYNVKHKDTISPDWKVLQKKSIGRHGLHIRGRVFEHDAWHAAVARTPRRAEWDRALHTLSRSPLAAHLGGCAPPSLFTAFRWREISKMAAARAAPAREADTCTPRLDVRRDPFDSSSIVPLVHPLREDVLEDGRVALNVPPVRRSWCK